MKSKDSVNEYHRKKYASIKVGDPLSRAQLMVANLLVQGLTNKEIANQLFVTEKTVKFHTTFIFKKTGCKNRGDFIANYWRVKNQQLESKMTEIS